MKITDDDIDKAATPDAYLIEYREVSKAGQPKRCTQASLEPHAPTIMLPYDKDVESRELLKATPLFAHSATRRSDPSPSEAAHMLATRHGYRCREKTADLCVFPACACDPARVVDDGTAK